MPAVATNADALRAEISGVEILHLRAVGTVAGVIINQAAARNGPGEGILAMGTAGTTISWQAPDSATPGTDVDISAGGEFLIEDGADPDKWLRITAYAAYLRRGESATVTLTDRYANGSPGDDVTASEATAGDVESWSVDLVNDSDETVYAPTAWLDVATDFLEISDDGVNWVSPTTQEDGLVLDDLEGASASSSMGAAQSVVLYIRRTIPAVTASDPAVLVHIHISWNDGPPTSSTGASPLNLDLRGLYRIFNTAVYRFYRSNSAPLAEGSSPFATNATLPHTPTDTYADGTWYLSASYFNGVLDSGFLPVGPRGETYLRLDLASGASTGSPPAGPLDWRVEAVAGGAVRVAAFYHEPATNRASQWTIAYTDNGDTPAEDHVDVYVAMEPSGVSVLDYTLPAADNGDTVKVRLQTRRNDGTDAVPVWVYSDGSTVKSVTADTTGPTTPLFGEGS
jgi:hypothetical protein